MPRVSVLIPAFNAGQTILSALDSAQSQTLEDIEILVIDSASTDCTADLVRSRARTDPRIQILRLPLHIGPAAARNAGLAAAKGEWIALLDADDAMMPNRLEHLLGQATAGDVLVADNLAFCNPDAAGTFRLGIKSEILGQGLRLDCAGYVARCKASQPYAIDFSLLQPLIRASHLRKHNIRYDENAPHAEDFRFYLDVLLPGGNLFVVPEALYRYSERLSQSKSVVRYHLLEAQARALAVDPRYAKVATPLRERAASIRKLAKIAVFSRRSRLSKIAALPFILADRDMRAYLNMRVQARLGKLHPSQWKNSTLLKDSSNLCLGQIIRLGLQGIYFLFIARSLGPAQYGAFVAVTAMASIISPYVGLGCGSLFLKNVRSGKRDAQLCWGNGLLLTFSTGMLTTAAFCALSCLWSPGVTVVVIGAICLSDLVLVRVIELASFGFAASGKMSKTAVQNTTMSLLRVIGILLLVFCYPQVTVELWTWVYLITAVIGALYAIQQGTALWGRPRISLPALFEDAREGCFFAISTSAQTIYNDIDKTMLARLSTLSATGVYAVAYRIIDTSLTPVRSLVTAAYPRFFSIGVQGMDATYKYAKSIIRKALVFGAFDFIGLVLIAPLLPHILGPKYANVTPAIQLLALIPLMRCINWFLADALSGANAQIYRTCAQVGVAILNIGLNLVILPRWSWVGAAWTSLASDGALVIVFYVIVHWKRSAEKSSAAVREVAHATD